MDAENEKRLGERRPLFAAAAPNLFPSAGERSVRSTESCSQRDESESLESLRLKLAPSTLDAIIAAQRPLIPSPQTPEDCSNDSLLGIDAAVHSSVLRKRKSLLKDDDHEESSHTKKKKKSKESPDEKKKKRKHKHRKHKSRSPSPKKSVDSDVSKIARPKGKIFLNELPDLKPEHAFYQDTKPNKDLLRYQSVSKLHLPKYKSFRFYNCLGNLCVLTKDFGHVKIEDKKLKITRYFGRESLRKNRIKGAQVLTRDETYTGTQMDFIALPREPTGEDSSDKVIGSYSCLDESTALYARGKGSNYAKPLEDAGENLLRDDIFEKVAEFNKKTREEPENIELWLDFVSFQDIATHENKTAKHEKIRLEFYQPTKSVIEKKLSILEKALEANPSCIKLKLLQLELYQNIWDSGKLEKAWEDFLFVHSANVDVWRQYLFRQQSQLSRFTFSRLVKCYHKCFRTLIPILDGQVKVVMKPVQLEEKIISLFSQYCDFLHQSGYTERAVSSFQALIEFNLYCPSSLNLSSSKQRAAQFEEFWESTAPKFGEARSVGWAKWMDNKKSENYTSLSGNTDEKEDAIVAKGLPRFSTWLKMEKVRQDSHWFPWRPDVSKEETEEDCEDLDRLVLMDDISPALFKLSKSQSCIRLVCLFLKFLGLCSERLEKKLQDCFDDPTGGESSQYSLNSLCQVPINFSICDGAHVDMKWTPDSNLLSFIREVLHQAESYFSATNRNLFTLLRIELEILKTGAKRTSELSKTDVKDLKKFGKNLLKESQNRNNLIIWDTYIRLLWACSDKMEETVSMLDVALAMFMGSSSLSEPDKAQGLCALCMTYSQIMLNFEPVEHVELKARHSSPSWEDKQQVIACLCALVDNKCFKSNTKVEITPAIILRIRRSFQRKLDELVLSLKSNSDHSYHDLIVPFVECFTLFEFCASNLKAATDLYSSTRNRIKNLLQEDNSNSQQLQSLVRMLYLSNIAMVSNVMHISSIPLTELRNVLDSGLQEFPECSQLIAAFLYIESNSHIAGRLRKYFEKRLKNPQSVLTVLFAVVSEMKRHQTVLKCLDVADPTRTGLSDSGTIHRVRSVFELAVERLSSSRHCPLLWRLYFMFEFNYGSKNKAKGILYRGLQSCPWVKSIYIDGVAIFGDSELQEMIDLMTEKEIRVRMPLEEVDLLLTAEKEDSFDEQAAAEQIVNDDVYGKDNVENNVQNDDMHCDDSVKDNVLKDDVHGDGSAEDNVLKAVDLQVEEKLIGVNEQENNA